MRRSIRIGRAPCLLGRTANPRLGFVMSQSEPPTPPPSGARSFACSAGGPGLFSLRVTLDAPIDCSPALPDHAQTNWLVRSCVQRAPMLRSPRYQFADLREVLPETSFHRRRQGPAPVTSTGRRSVILEPFWERPAGTQTHSRRTERRLGDSVTYVKK